MDGAAHPTVADDAPTLADLALDARWVVWQTRRTKKGKAVKVPLSPWTGRAADVRDPRNWGTRDRAAACHARLPPNGQGPSGVGLVLGPVPNSATVGGVDLDSCRDPGTGAVAPWAQEVIDGFGSYAEVSPSGTGVKVFFRYRPEDLPALRQALGGARWKRSWRRGGADAGRAHPPAIELHLGGGYFAVTGERLAGASVGLRVVPGDLLLWLACEAGPAFEGGRAAAEQATPAPDARWSVPDGEAARSGGGGERGHSIFWPEHLLFLVRHRPRYQLEVFALLNSYCAVGPEVASATLAFATAQRDLRRSNGKTRSFHTLHAAFRGLEADGLAVKIRPATRPGGPGSARGESAVYDLPFRRFGGPERPKVPIPKGVRRPRGRVRWHNAQLRRDLAALSEHEFALLVFLVARLHRRDDGTPEQVSDFELTVDGVAEELGVAKDTAAKAINGLVAKTEALADPEKDGWLRRVRAAAGPRPPLYRLGGYYTRSGSHPPHTPPWIEGMLLVGRCGQAHRCSPWDARA